MSDKLEKLRSLYEKADSFAREVTDFRSEVAIPAHNELRYAGHHLLKALADDGSIANCDDIRKAENHCERSMYEASEAGIAFALALVREFKHTYRTLVISEVISDYSPKLDRIREAQALIIKGRAERTSVTEHVQEYLEAFREVRDIVAHFEAHRDDLNLKRRKERRQYLFAILGIVIGLLGIVITLVG